MAQHIKYEHLVLKKELAYNVSHMDGVIHMVHFRRYMFLWVG